MKETLRKEIGIRMRKVRKTLGYTQDQMVEFFDIGRANYSRIEKGEIFPGSTILNTLRNKFNVSLDWLICNKGSMYHEQGVMANGYLGDDGDEIRDLLFHMERIPMVRHAVLGFFMEYKFKNKEQIENMYAYEPKSKLKPGEPEKD